MNKNKFFYSFVSLIIVSILILLIWTKLHHKSEETPIVIPAGHTTLEEDTNIENLLSDARQEINRYKGLSGHLDTLISEANIQIKAKEIRITDLLKNNILEENEKNELQKEIKFLRDNYLNTIDSLLLARNSNSTLNKSIQQLEEKILELNKRLGIAERMVIENFIVTPQSTNAKGKNSTTALARKTDNIKLCFDILPNNITPVGEYLIYIRIFNPDGDVIVNTNMGSGRFRHPEYKIDVAYTANTLINYQQDRLSKCIDWLGTEKYFPGIYMVEIYTDNYSITTLTFSLQ